MSRIRSMTPGRRRLFGIGLALLFLAVAFFALKGRAHAQETAPAQSSATAARGSDPATQGGRETEPPDEKDEYRLSPTTQKIARALHMDPRLAATLFDWLNFGVLAAAIVIALRKVMPKMFKQRSQQLEGQITDARAATLDARHRLDVVEERLSRLDQDIIALRGQAEREMMAEEERFRASLDAERERIVDAAEEEIAAAGAAARRDLRALAAELAVAHAERNLKLTPEMDHAIVGEFAARLGTDNRLGKGSNN